MNQAQIDRVMEVGEELIGERGFFRVDLGEVAEAAGVPVEEVRSEFGDTAHLLVRIVQVRAHELRVHLHHAVEGLSSRSMMEGAGFQAFFDWVAAHPYHYRLLRQAEVVDPAVFRFWYRDLASDYVRGLTRAMDEGEIARGDPETLTYCLMGMGDMLGMRYVEWEGRKQIPAEVWNTFQRVMNRALQAR